MKKQCLTTLFVVAFLVVLSGIQAAAQADDAPRTSAWKDGHLQIDTAGVVGRSDVVSGQPNLKANQAMPLGNGRLGVAIWAEDGLTAQLNRADTWPARLSPGQVVIPGLLRLIKARNYSGRLNLYNGEFVEQGGGMSATAFVDPEKDTLVIDVTGADPAKPQTAQLRLWDPRKPQASKSGSVGWLAESWIDDKNPGASGRTFGSLAGITVEARHVTVAVTDPVTVTLSFRPSPNGTFRVLVAAPHYEGKDDPASLLHSAFSLPSVETHRQAWNGFWHRAGLIKLTSADGSAEYMENLRTLYLYNAHASSGGEYPSSQAGIADLFSSVRDVHHWDPAAYWHWNLRMQVAANLGAGLPELNAPYFRLYRDNLGRIQDWTTKHMGGRPGICVPETMRFNGQGIEYETGEGWGKGSLGLNCAAESKPYYNARTISTGAEISLWIWQQYLQTEDRQFLEDNYPVMAAAARFLLAYQKAGQDGLDHTSPSNAHETQWDVTDPVTDVAARTALFPVVVEAEKLLGRDADLADQLRAAIPRVPPLPRIRQTAQPALISASAQPKDAVIAPSYVPAAEKHNVENLGLEPVWPYDLIGDQSSHFETARRTYATRPYPMNQDWSFDPIQAARLGLGREVEKTLDALTTQYQSFVNGFANWGGEFGEFYIEQQGVVATALEEALVQDYDGLIRIVPALPPGWDAEGTVFVRGKTKVDVQMKDGVLSTVAVESGSNQNIRIRNPWPGHAISVIDTSSGKEVERQVNGKTISFTAAADGSYRLQPDGQPVPAFAPIDGTPARSSRSLGPAQIGLSPRD